MIQLKCSAFRRICPMTVKSAMSADRCGSRLIFSSSYHLHHHHQKYSTHSLRMDVDVEPASEQSTSAWTCPEINLDPNKPPKITARGSPSIDDAYPDNFFRSAKW